MTQPQNSPAPGAEQSESGASVVSENKYHGAPCQNCEGTLRYKAGAKCVACSKRRSRAWMREKRSNDPEWAEKQQLRQREKRRADLEYRERKREYMREWREKYRAEPEYRERRAAQKRKTRMGPILADPTIQEFLRMQHPLVKKLEAMIADRAASRGEKDNAYRILERKGLLPTSNRRHAWLRRQTTFGATRNTQHETKSLPS